MFKPDMFLLPNGEPMSATEIAEMLNNWKEAPTPSVTRQPMLKSIGIHSVPVMRSRGTGINFDNSNAPAYTAVEKVDVPIYPQEEVIRLISDMMYYNVSGKNLIAIGAVLGPDYYLSINLRRKTHEPVQELHTMYGTVKIHLGEEMSTIKFIYANPDWGRLL